MSTFPGSNSKPILEQVRDSDRDHLLAWVSVQCLALRDANLENSEAETLSGVLLECDYDSFRKEVVLDVGTAKGLDIPVRRIKSEGLKSKFHLPRICVLLCSCRYPLYAGFSGDNSAKSKALLLLRITYQKAKTTLGDRTQATLLGLSRPSGTSDKKF